MTLSLKTGIAGEFRLQVLKDGKVKTDTGWFPNLITDTGLDNQAITNSLGAFRYYSVGTGSTTPAFTDTNLVSRVATVDATGGAAASGTTANGRWASRSIAFATGAVVGNITELGTGPYATGLSLSSRALILDANQLPTSITVLADETLVMAYKVHLLPSLSDVTTTHNGYTFTLRACNVLGVGPNIYTQWNWGDPKAVAQQGTHFGVFNGTMSAPLAANPASLGSNSTAVATNSILAYTLGSYKRTIRYSCSTAQANGTWNLIILKAFVGVFQMSISPSIVKTSQKTMTVAIELSWNRTTVPVV